MLWRASHAPACLQRGAPPPFDRCMARKVELFKGKDKRKYEWYGLFSSIISHQWRRAK
jgi:hypothetical protein